MKSLFDYLGRAGGKELGRQVYKYAKMKKDIIVEWRKISNPKYDGFVALYDSSFLDEFFEMKAIFGN